MSRGGRREGAGGRFKWKHGRTKTIRVPEVLANQILEYAHKIDDGVIIEHETSSNPVTENPVTSNQPIKIINFAGIPIYRFQDRSYFFLEDLIKSGYQIKPKKLADRILDETYKSQIRQGNLSNGI